ncbi:MlaD family protein [Flavobacterium granuli]|uniref:Phospholipid/cholesterol/gamma-HCH transport system substrate-binding protein n=1 Tax=Flavobacterium granuli TaxID=280093 RepID=A0A1M5I7A1_9FLAO|nr:MlaD family protein [Flavobacterium granuli]PRZ27822.1 phospholipid/cholesterol/gamma-HCH transport system substrate-binding protein [Flavobacterium granuli]SHG24047.1 phospholipid/cholesterol/gamma-HCH transport system substrate-binding protein [Flavobacterium granuli]
MEKTTSQKIKLGLFVIIGLMVFILAIYFIGDKQKMFGKTTHLETVFNNVNGLQIGNNVRYSGVNVGTVRGIEMINDTNIKVDMIIDKNIFKHIKKDAVATIGSDGLVGSMIINIIPGKGLKPNVEPGDVIHSQDRIRTDDILNTLSKTNQNAAILTENLLKITNDINQGKGTVGLLISDIEMARDLKQTLHYLKISGKETSLSVSNLNKLITSLDNKKNVIGVLKDTAVAAKIKNIIFNLNQSSTEIDKVIGNLNKTVLNIKDGKGAINYLSNDPNLVQNIDSTMININEASKRLNENLEALKHNFLFRGYFKKQEKAKLKEQKK